LTLGGLLAVYGIVAELVSAAARQRAEQIAPRALVLLRPLEWLVWPFCYPVGAVAQVLSRVVRKSPAPSTSLVESEVEILVNEGELNGSLAHDQSEMIRNVLDFGDIRAGDIMMPRTAVTAVDIDLPVREFLKIVTENEHSRYPVYRERIDNVIGVLHVKDLITHADLENLDRVQLSDLMRTPVMYVPESQLASSVLTEMRVEQQHMAIVIDEFGGMSGIITIEDLIEEIVGDIRDEHDDEEPPIVDMGEGRLLVQASVPINDLSRYLGTDLPEDDEYNSLGGFIVEQMGRVPKAGESLEHSGLTLIVQEADERHVSKVEIQRPTVAGRVSSAPPRPAA
jgi:CBS domain containing-hemolysin-like protein